MTHTTHSLEELSIKLQEHTSNTDMTDVQFIKMLQIIDHYTTTKINEVLDAVEDAIGRDEPSYTLDNPSWEVNRARNDLRAELRQKLSQIRKEKVNE